ASLLRLPLVSRGLLDDLKRQIGQWHNMGVGIFGYCFQVAATRGLSDQARLAPYRRLRRCVVPLSDIV
ncbi:MAG: hypothetical protein WAO13_06930, partial [Pseudolabrys sp.]